MATQPRRASYLSAALIAPVWGRLADRYCRKLTLIRASLGMAVAIGALRYSVSAQYAGEVIGRVLDGFVGCRIGMRAVFLGTCVLMAAGAAANAWAMRRRAFGQTTSSACSSPFQ